MKLRKFNVDFHVFTPHESKKIDERYKGGYEKTRTDETTARNIEYLKEKYPFLELETVGLNESVTRKINWRKFHRK